MDFTGLLRPVVSKLLALQTFFFERPRLDIDLKHDETNLYGQKSFGPSRQQAYEEPVPITFYKHDFEFYWNFKLRIKNNSSKAAYEIRIEKIIPKTAIDYLQKVDELASLKSGDQLEVDYKIRHRTSMSGRDAEKFLTFFPGHLDKIEIIISYTNESRSRFYTKFTMDRNGKMNEHLILKPKI